MTQDIIEKLLSKVQGPLHEDLCWERTDTWRDRNGYTFVSHGNRKIRAHRLSWEIHNAEPIPEGLVVLHSCNNPSCCNPNHLRVGTQKDNSHDYLLKTDGAIHAGGKAYEYDYDEICDYRETHGLTIKQTAEYFGCGTATVHRAIRHRKDQRQAG